MVDDFVRDWTFSDMLSDWSNTCAIEGGRPRFRFAAYAAAGVCDGVITFGERSERRSSFSRRRSAAWIAATMAGSRDDLREGRKGFGGGAVGPSGIAERCVITVGVGLGDKREDDVDTLEANDEIDDRLAFLGRLGRSGMARSDPNPVLPKYFIEIERLRLDLASSNLCLLTLLAGKDDEDSVPECGDSAPDICDDSAPESSAASRRY